MTFNSNIEHRRQHQRPAQHRQNPAQQQHPRSTHHHQHIHRHQSVTIYQAPPVQPTQPPNPALLPSPTVNTTLINAPTKTSIRSYAPTVHASQTFSHPPQQQSDDFGAFVCGLLSAVAIGLAIFGGGGGGGGGGPRR